MKGFLMSTNVTAIILAAGSGSRMKLSITKQKIKVGAESVLHRTLRIFNECPDIGSIVVVVREDEYDFAKGEATDFDKVKKITVGGKTRAESAQLGFQQISDRSDFVAIHDAARCFVTSDMISRVIENAKKYGAATASCKVTDTVKRINQGGFIEATLPREELILVQTPQVFKTELYREAIEQADFSDTSLTDDNMMVEKIGVHPYATDTGKYNIKLTTQEDLLFADLLLNGETDKNG